MLKACFECITSGIPEANDVYGRQNHMNGNSQAGIMSISDTGMILCLPKALNREDDINITSVFSDNVQWVSVSLIAEENGSNVPGKGNIAGSIKLDFKNNKISIKTEENGEEMEPDAPEYNTPQSIVPNYNETASFTVKLKVCNEADRIEIFVGESSLKVIDLKYDISSIKYLMLDGDIQKVSNLNFIYA